MSTISSPLTLTQAYVDSNSWPITINGGTVDNPTVITFGENLTFTSNQHYFEFGSDYNTLDGNNKTVSISGVSNYKGLVKNGAANITIQNIRVVSTNSSTLALEHGWISWKFYGGGIIRNCSSTGDITPSSGGIVGANASSYGGVLDIVQCFSTGNIVGGEAGGIVGRAAGGDSGAVRALNCYSTGIIGTNFYDHPGCGGIFGATPFSNGAIRTSATNCYSTNYTGASYSGGIVGQDAKGIDVSNCFSAGSLLYSSIDQPDRRPGGIFGSNPGNNVSATNCYVAGCMSVDRTRQDSCGNYIPGIFAKGPINHLSQFNCYVDSTWNTADASSVLQGIGIGTWNTDVSNNPSPRYLLSAFNPPPTIGEFVIPFRTYGSPPFSITDPSSNNTNAFTYTSSNNGVATVSGTTITVGNVGRTTITALQSPNNTYGYGTTTAIFDVSRATPTITNFSIPKKGYNDPSFNITDPSSNSSGRFVYTSGTPSVATISGKRITIIGAGSSIITATQEASGNYGVGTATATFIVNPAPTYGIFNIPTKAYGYSPFSIIPPISNSTGAFTYTSGTPSVATVSGDVITIVGVGSSVITATQPAVDDFASGSTTGVFTVNPGIPTIGPLSITTKAYGTAPFAITPPTSNSTGRFVYTSVIPSVATVSGDVITIVGAGSSTIIATQDACGNYASGTKTGTFTVNPIAPTIGTLTLPGKIYNDASFAITPPTSNSTGRFVYTSGTPSVATVSGDVITIVGAGSSTIIATQEASGNYISGSTTALFDVSRAIPTIGTLNLPTGKKYNDEPFTITHPTSNSSGRFVYTSGTPGVATVSGDVITIVGAGTSTISATQDACGNYASGTATAVFDVSRAYPIYTSFIIPDKQYRDPPFSITDPSSNNLTGGFTYASNNSSVATVSGNIIQVRAIGSANITATQAATANYLQGSIDASFTVTPIKNFSSDIYLDSALISQINWPLTILGGVSGTPITLTVGEDLIFTDYRNFFNISGSYVTIDGDNHTIEIDGVPNYSGLVNNRTHSNVILQNISITSSGGTSLADGAGWIGQLNYGEDASGLQCNNCNSSGPIGGVGSGGIFGRDLASGASHISINECYSTGVISGIESGGIVGAYCQNASIENCYSTGSITASEAGGVVGYGAVGSSIYTNQSYSQGAIKGINSRGVYSSLIN